MDKTQLEPGSIVVGVDGSAAADEAVLWAAEQAALENRPVTLLHAYRAPSSSQTAWLAQAGVPRSGVLDDMRTEGREILATAAGQVAWKEHDVVVRQVLEEADPRQALLERAGDAALVVLGSRGLGPVASLLLGSVSAAVSRHATCPVVVVRPRGAGIVRNGVLVGTDGTARTRGTLELAYRQASFRHLPLTVLLCFDDGPLRSGIVSDHEGTSAEDNEVGRQRRLLAETVSGMAEKFPDVIVHQVLVRGLPEHHLTREGHRMDLLVVGHHCEDPTRQWAVGSVANAVVEHATCTVVVVPDRA